MIPIPQASAIVDIPAAWLVSSLMSQRIDFVTPTTPGDK